MAPRTIDVTAAVLAGGLGTRLQSVVADRPKVVAEVGGRPHLGYLLDQLRRFGLREVVLLAGHLADRLRATLGDEYDGMRLHYSVEAEPLGTGGAVRHALPLLQAPRVLLLNGDSYCDFDLPGLFQHHVDHRRAATLSVVQVADAGRYGRVRMTADDQVMRFQEKQAHAGPGWVNAGVYLLNRPVIAALPPGPRSLEREVLPDLVRAGQVRGHRVSGAFLDIGTPEAYAGAAAFFARLACPVAA
ncbi:MAG: nucleotidyltransferase family protein [Gemmataceae bacterium]